MADDNKANESIESDIEGGRPEITRIFLVGFMGAGKTTVGRELARLLGYNFLDLDDLICERAGKSVRQIFDEDGESEFRRLEREAIKDCRNLQKAIIALGGGAFVFEGNRILLKTLGKTVWLDCSLDECLRRLGSDPSRPLLSSRDQMQRLLEERRPAYSLADYTVQSGKHSPSEIALEIKSLITR